MLVHHRRVAKLLLPKIQNKCVLSILLTISALILFKGRNLDMKYLNVIGYAFPKMFCLDLNINKELAKGSGTHTDGTCTNRSSDTSFF